MKSEEKELNEATEIVTPFFSSLGMSAIEVAEGLSYINSYMNRFGVCAKESAPTLKIIVDSFNAK